MKLADYDSISPNHTTRIDNCEATSVTIRSCCPMPNYQQVARESRGNPTDKVKGNFIRVGNRQGILMYVKDISVLTTQCHREPLLSQNVEEGVAEYRYRISLSANSALVRPTGQTTIINWFGSNEHHLERERWKQERTETIGWKLWLAAHWATRLGYM